MSGTLYFGDNLDVLREHVRDESVDLIYLDPPFNSNADYGVLFRSPDGGKSTSQIKAFEDTWVWGETSERAFDDVMRSGRSEVANVLRAFRQFLGENDMMAYLAMMTVRLIELHRVLKPTGALYLHCDPTASHYLRVTLDAIFGADCLRGEIIWKRTNARGTHGRWPRLHDTIIHFAKSAEYRHNTQFVDGDMDKLPHTLITGPDGLKYQTFELTGAGTRQGETGQAWRGFDPNAFGRHWGNLHARMEEWDRAGLIHWPKKGGFPRRRAEQPFEASARKVVLGDVWTDIDRLNQSAQERLGYPTQKPVALLERILAASSKPGDVVLDPFCGCGTTVHAAEKMGRRWVGIDITPLAINLIARRLRDAFHNLTYEVRGIPKDMDGARELAARDKHLFQLWATDVIGAQPFRDGKKGADGSVDGMIYFKPDGRTTKAAIVSVKGGANRDVSHVRDLRGTIERLQEPMGVLVTLYSPTEPMRREAAASGLYDSGFGKPTPRIQLVTVEDALKLGERAVQIPYGHSASFKQAPRESRPDAQHAFDMSGAIAASSRPATRPKKGGAIRPGKLRQVSTNRSSDLIDLASKAMPGLPLIAAAESEGNEIAVQSPAT